MSFTSFMEKQCDEIEASGMDADEWIELNAEAFRIANPVDEE